MKVWIVTEDVDLGCAIVAVCSNKNDAEEIAADKNTHYLDLYGSSRKSEWFWVEEWEVR